MLAKSGFKICIIKYGRVDSSRALIKLSRIQKGLLDSIDLSDGLTQETKISTTELLRSALYEVADSSFFSLLTKSNYSLKDESASFFYHRANGEADPEIRRFAKDKCKSGRVMILSGDASLIVGLPSRCELISPFSLCVSIDQYGKKSLYGRPMPLHRWIIQLNNEVDKLVQSLGNEIITNGISLVGLTDEDIVGLAALSGGELVVINDQTLPSLLDFTCFMTNYLLPYNHGLRKNKKLCELVVRALLLRAFKTSIPATPKDDIYPIVDAIVKYAKSKRPLFGILK